MKAKEDRLGQRLRRLASSRDVWKRRAHEKQSMIRYLRVKVRDLEVSRELWKDRANAVAAHGSSPSVEPEHSIGQKLTGE